jgi:hypothetical protein
VAAQLPEASEPAEIRASSNGRLVYGIAAGVILLAAAGGTLALHSLTRGVWSALLAALVTILWLTGAAILSGVLRDRTGFLTTTFAVPAMHLARPVVAVVSRVVAFILRVIIGILNSLLGVVGPTGVAGVDLSGVSDEQVEAIINRAYDQLMNRWQQQQHATRWRRRAALFLSMVFGAFLGWLMYYYLPAPPHALYPPSGS